MRRSALCGLMLSAVVFVPAVMAAQTCLGLPSFSRGPVNFRATYIDADQASSIGAGIQAGGRSTFGGASINRVSYSEFDESAFGVSANVGTQIPLGESKRASVCPVVEAGLGFGPDFDFLGSSVEIRERNVSGGLYFGTNLDAGENLRIIPNAGISYIYGGAKITADGETIAEGTDSYGAARLGLGFMFSGVFGVTPFVAIPIGLDGADSNFGVYASIAFGKR